jgi:hypothetical protein
MAPPALMCGKRNRSRPPSMATLAGSNRARGAVDCRNWASTARLSDGLTVDARGVRLRAWACALRRGLIARCSGALEDPAASLISLCCLQGMRLVAIR